MWVQHKLGEVALPTFSRPTDEDSSFKLSVHVHAASVPGLADARLLKRDRPRVEIIMGQVRKETELGDHRADMVRPVGDEGSAVEGSSGLPSLSTCPWRFGDTLTFVASRSDILGPGLQVWLRTQSEMRFGSLIQMNMSSATDVGVCSIDLRRRVLPACVQTAAPVAAAVAAEVSSRPFLWETPVMVLPLTHIGGRGHGATSERTFVLGEAVGHVALSFAVNVDPAALLRSADLATMPLHVRAVQPLCEWTARAADGVSRSVVTAAQQISGPNIAYAAGVAQEWSVKTVDAAAQGVQWVIENNDLEGCAVKTRDRATNFLGDDCGQTRGRRIKYAACEAMPTASPALSSTAPVAGVRVTAKPPTWSSAKVHLSPVGSAATTAAGQSPLTLRSASADDNSFVLGTPLRAQEASLLGGPSNGASERSDTKAFVEKALAASLLVQSGAASTGTAPARPQPLQDPAAQARLATGSAASGAYPAAATATSSANRVGAAAATSRVARAQGASSGPPTVVHYTQQAPVAGLPPSRSFVYAGGLPPSRQSFQVVHVVPPGQGLPSRQSFQVAQGQGLPSRQSFQVITPTKVVRAPPKYVRPGTL